MTMLGRLSDVIYWLCCALAVIQLVIVAGIWLNPGGDALTATLFLSGGAVAVLLFGRAVRYVVTGR